MQPHLLDLGIARVCTQRNKVFLPPIGTDLLGILDTLRRRPSVLKGTNEAALARHALFLVLVLTSEAGKARKSQGRKVVEHADGA